jgi:xanthine dehydrogenase/oxidase
VKVGRSVRLNLERQVDMSVTGQRHPFKVEYKVGFTNEGRLLALDVQMWSNAGCSTDISLGVMFMAMLHMGNCYQCSNMKIRGNVCKTHLPSNTGLL